MWDSGHSAGVSLSPGGSWWSRETKTPDTPSCDAFSRMTAGCESFSIGGQTVSGIPIGSTAVFGLSGSLSSVCLGQPDVTGVIGLPFCLRCMGEERLSGKKAISTS